MGVRITSRLTVYGTFGGGRGYAPFPKIYMNYFETFQLNLGTNKAGYLRGNNKVVRFEVGNHMNLLEIVQFREKQ